MEVDASRLREGRCNAAASETICLANSYEQTGKAIDDWLPSPFSGHRHCLCRSLLLKRLNNNDVENRYHLFWPPQLQCVRSFSSRKSEGTPSTSTLNLIFYPSPHSILSLLPLINQLVNHRVLSFFLLIRRAQYQRHACQSGVSGGFGICGRCLPAQNQP